MTPEEKEKAGCYYVSSPWGERDNLTAFAMAAVTLGAILRPREPYLDRTYLDGGKPIRTAFWFLESRTRGAGYKLSDLWKWWNDPTWREENPDHPLCELWAYADNLRRAHEHMASCPEKVMLIRDKKHLLIAKNTPPEMKKRAYELLEGKSEQP